MNLPLGIGALVVPLRIVPNVELPAGSALDVFGIVFVVMGLGALVWAPSIVIKDGIDVPVLVVTLAVGVVATGLAIRHLLRVAAPLLDLRVFRFESFRVVNFGGSVYRATISAMPFLLPLLFQDAFGWSPGASGAVLLTLFIGNIGIKPVTPWMLRTFGFRSVLVASNAVGNAYMVAMAFLTASVPILLVMVLLIVSGAARSSGFTPTRPSRSPTSITTT